MDLAGIKEKRNLDKSFKVKKRSPVKHDNDSIFKNSERVGGWNNGNKSNSRDSRVDYMN